MQVNAMGFAVPTVEDFAAGRVTNPDQSEVVRQRLYDWQLYATAGVAQLSFFTLPIGQGVTTAAGAVVGTAKTLWDTNLQLPNQLPSGKAYAPQSIEVQFWPGSSAAANTYTRAIPSIFAAVAAATVTQQTDDVESFYQSGLLTFSVLDKNYVVETPMSCFPPQTGISIEGAVSSNSATTAEVGVIQAKCIGRPYVFDIPFSLLPAQNFLITITYPAAVATPSGFNGRVGVILDGYLLRASQ